MMNDFPYQYIPVREMPPALAETITRLALHKDQERPAVNLRPLSEARGRVGPLLVPSYLPEPFSYERAFVAAISDPRFKNPIPPALTFHGPAGEKDVIHLRIAIHLLPPREMRPFPVELKEGAFHPVPLKWGLSYFIRGSWGAYINGSSVNLGWQEDSGLALQFVRDDYLVEVIGMPTSAFSEAEFIKIAESLQPY